MTHTEREKHVNALLDEAAKAIDIFDAYLRAARERAEAARAEAKR